MSGRAGVQVPIRERRGASPYAPRAARREGEVLVREAKRGRVYALRVWAYGARR
jgi:hypothetical protein